MLDLSKQKKHKGRFKPVLFLFFLVVFSSSVFAICTVTLDKDIYFPQESPTATMFCTTGNEKNQAYTLTWHNTSQVLETDVGVTPNTAGEFFFESFTIPAGASWENANATLEGVNLEGADFFNVTGANANSLIIRNITFTPTRDSLIGKHHGTLFEVINAQGNLVSNAQCEVSIEDGNDLPISISKNIITYAGKGHAPDTLTIDKYEESRQYLTQIGCYCVDQETNVGCVDNLGGRVNYSVGSGKGIFETTNWLTVNTLTDKDNYVLEDEQVLVCANVTNNHTTRIPIEIFYSYRCDGDNDSSTERVLINEFTELRGISNGTTQNQCAGLPIRNVRTIQNTLSICYASTDVKVLDETSTNILFTYPTTSANFNISSNSDFFNEGGISMEGFAIVFIVGLIVLIGLVFFWFGLHKEDPTLLNLSGIAFMIAGVFLIIEGITGIDNLIVRALGGIFIGVGFYIMVRTNIETL